MNVELYLLVHALSKGRWENVNLCKNEIILAGPTKVYFQDLGQVLLEDCHS